MYINKIEKNVLILMPLSVLPADAGQKDVLLLEGEGRIQNRHAVFGIRCLLRINRIMRGMRTCPRFYTQTHTHTQREREARVITQEDVIF